MPSKKPKVTAADIKMALGRRHQERDFFVTECKNGPTGTGLLIFDAVAIKKSWAHPCIIGYEIKVSRSDFQRDAKYAQYMQYCHEFYFVVPAGLVDRTEVEPEIGLIYYNPEKQSLQTKRKAQYRQVEVNADMLMYIFMTRLESDRVPFFNTKREYWEAWLAGKIGNRELAYRVKSKLLKENRDLADRLRSFERRKETYDEVSAVLQEINDILVAHGEKYVGYHELPEAIEKALERPLPKRLDDVEDRLNSALRLIKNMREGLQSCPRCGGTTYENKHGDLMCAACGWREAEAV